MLVDSSLYSSGATLTNVVISGATSSGAQNAGWSSAVGVSVSGNSLTKTSVDGWNAGAVSTQTISSGDGYVEWTASETTTARMIGLGNGDSSQSYTDIEYALKVGGGGNLDVWESGNSIGWVGTYAAGDLLRVAVEGGVVKYRKNGALLYTSTVAPNYPLLVDSSLYSSGSTLNNVIISTGSGGSSTATINWLVSDHLGTPRMIIDQTGALANVKRHDYLPFGEELYAGVGGRTIGLGYSGDAVRQKFTSKERDIETGLDFFEARYFSSTQGRFTSTDPIFISRKRLLDPQGINLYAYARNNPLAYFDPDGEEFKGTDGKRVDIEEVDGQLVIRSKNGTKDLTRLVNLINKSGSSLALGQFNKLNASKTMINLVIDTTTVGGGLLGLHAPNGTRPDGSKGVLKFDEKTNQFAGTADLVKDANGNEVYAEATITLFEGELRSPAIYGDNTEAVEDELVGTFGHEAQHDLDPRQIQATKTHTGTDAIYHPRNPDGSPAPGSPYWFTYRIRDEIRDVRALRAVKCIHGNCGGPP